MCMVIIICCSHVHLGDVNDGLNLDQILFMEGFDAELDKSSSLHLHLFAILEVVVEDCIQVHPHVVFLNTRNTESELDSLHPFAVSTI